MGRAHVLGRRAVRRRPWPSPARPIVVLKLRTVWRASARVVPSRRRACFARQARSARARPAIEAAAGLCLSSLPDTRLLEGPVVPRRVECCVAFERPSAWDGHARRKSLLAPSREACWAAMGPRDVVVANLGVWFNEQEARAHAPRRAWPEKPPLNPKPQPKTCHPRGWELPGSRLSTRACSGWWEC